jgi:hypothetical protein
MNNSDMPINPLVNDKGTVTYVTSKEGRCLHARGLSKREHFAGQTLQALLSNSTMGDSALWDTPQEWTKQMTETAVEMADALLEELDK